MLDKWNLAVAAKFQTLVNNWSSIHQPKVNNCSTIGEHHMQKQRSSITERHYPVDNPNLKYEE